VSDSVVVVGGGIAGQAVCEALREHDGRAPITLVCAEPRLPYDRVRLSEILVSGTSTETLQLRPPEWFEDHRVGVLTGRRVVAVRADERLVELDDRTVLPYATLVLATGSNPLLPPIPGIDLPHVHPFRDPEDCEAIRDAAARAEHGAVIGGGLLGL
jgi:nitrite reductase [NAD(P)H] large subunit